MAVFWVVMPYSPVEVYRRFRGTCYRIIALTMEAESTSEISAHFYHTTRRNDPLTAVRTSNSAPIMLVWKRRQKRLLRRCGSSWDGNIETQLTEIKFEDVERIQLHDKLQVLLPCARYGKNAWKASDCLTNWATTYLQKIPYILVTLQGPKDGALYSAPLFLCTWSVVQCTESECTVSPELVLPDWV
jgi:hypothetical protein